MAKTLHQQFREAKAQMQEFVKDGDIEQDAADKMMDHARRAIKALRADRH